MYTLKMSIDHVGIFSGRLAAKEPNCQPLWDGEKFLIPDEFAAVAKEVYELGFGHTPAELTSLAGAHRRVKEDGGFSHDGARFSTDGESLSRLALAVAAAMNDPQFKAQWKTTEGKFISLDAAKMIALGTAAGNFLTACATAEAQINASVFSGVLTSHSQVTAMFAAIK